jgi:hypothetical protein
MSDWDEALFTSKIILTVGDSSCVRSTEGIRARLPELQMRRAGDTGASLPGTGVLVDKDLRAHDFEARMVCESGRAW